MAVRKKGRRKVNYKGRQYVWHVQDKDQRIPREGGFVEPVKERYLHIIDNKKQFIVHYRLPEPRDEIALLKIEGGNFHASRGRRMCMFRVGDTTVNATPRPILCAA